MAYVPPIKFSPADLVALHYRPRGKLVMLFKGTEMMYPPVPSPARQMQEALREAFEGPAEDNTD